MSVVLWSQPPRSPSRTLTFAVDDRLKIGGNMFQSVVVLEKDPKVARCLVGGLRPHYSVHLTGSREELRDNLTRTRPEAVVLNIEHGLLADVESLRRDFPALPIVCTHRIPDDEMWMAALAAGASDVCPADDVENVLTSVRKNVALSRSAAA